MIKPHRQFPVTIFYPSGNTETFFIEAPDERYFRFEVQHLADVRLRCLFEHDVAIGIHTEVGQENILRFMSQSGIEVERWELVANERA